ncbi:MAG: ADP-ribosylglycohydrolase family protein [Eubacteriales bacterium]|nr:ADP-ribosylglycohydrolase family protein [Eubacteriales bacterium]
MLGAIFGDIVGSVYEFNNTHDYNFQLLRRSSEPTDDSYMTLAVAKALMETYGQDDDTIRAAVVKNMREIGHRYPHAGYGGMFYRWLRKKNPQPYNSFGNGSAMRVSPAGWLYRTLEETLHAAKLTAEVTHNHPEGIKGAQAIAAAIFLARAGAEKEDIINYIANTFDYNLFRSLDQIRRNYYFYETCQKSVPEAIIAFFESEDYEDAIRKAVSLGGDSDTIACMTGAIAEAYYRMPSAFKEEALNRLAPAMQKIVHDFRNFYRMHSGKPLDGWQEAVRIHHADEPFLKHNAWLEEKIDEFYAAGEAAETARLGQTAEGGTDTAGADVQYAEHSTETNGANARYAEHSMETDSADAQTVEGGTDTAGTQTNRRPSVAEPDPVPVLQAILLCMQDEGHVLVPVELPDEALKVFDPEKIKKGDEVTSDEDLHFKLIHLTDDDGNIAMPVFTSSEKMEEAGADGCSVFSMFLDEYIKQVLEMENVEGIVINPGPRHFILRKDVLRVLAAQSESEKIRVWTPSSDAHPVIPADIPEGFLELLCEFAKNNLPEVANIWFMGLEDRGEESWCFAIQADNKDEEGMRKIYEQIQTFLFLLETKKPVDYMCVSGRPWDEAILVFSAGRPQ